MKKAKHNLVKTHTYSLIKIWGRKMLTVVAFGQLNNTHLWKFINIYLHIFLYCQTSILFLFKWKEPRLKKWAYAPYKVPEQRGTPFLSHVHLIPYYLIAKVLAQARPSSSTKVYNRLLVIQHVEAVHYEVFVTRVKSKPTDLCQSFSFLFVEISAAVFIPVKRQPSLGVFLSLIRDSFTSSF